MATTCLTGLSQFCQRGWFKLIIIALIISILVLVSIIGREQYLFHDKDDDVDGNKSSENTNSHEEVNSQRKAFGPDLADSVITSHYKHNGALEKSYRGEEERQRDDPWRGSVSRVAESHGRGVREVRDLPLMLLQHKLNHPQGGRCPPDFCGLQAEATRRVQGRKAFLYMRTLYQAMVKETELADLVEDSSSANWAIRSYAPELRSRDSVMFKRSTDGLCNVTHLEILIGLRCKQDTGGQAGIEAVANGQRVRQAVGTVQIRKAAVFDLSAMAGNPDLNFTVTNRKCFSAAQVCHSMLFEFCNMNGTVRRHFQQNKSSRAGSSENSRDADSKDSRDADSEDSRNADFKDSRDADSKDRRDADSQDRRDADSQDSRDADSQDSRDADSQDSRDADSEDSRDADSQDRRDADSQDSRDADSEDRRDADSQDRRDADSEDSRDADFKDRRDADSEDSRDADSQDNRDADSENRHVADSEDSRNADFKDSRNADFKDSLDANSKNNLDADSKDSRDSNSRQGTGQSKKGMETIAPCIGCHSGTDSVRETSGEHEHGFSAEHLAKMMRLADEWTRKDDTLVASRMNSVKSHVFIPELEGRRAVPALPFPVQPGLSPAPTLPPPSSPSSSLSSSPSLPSSQSLSSQSSSSSTPQSRSDSSTTTRVSLLSSSAQMTPLSKSKLASPPSLLSKLGPPFSSSKQPVPPPSPSSTISYSSPPLTLASSSPPSTLPSSSPKPKTSPSAEVRRSKRNVSCKTSCPSTTSAPLARTCARHELKVDLFSDLHYPVLNPDRPVDVGKCHGTCIHACHMGQASESLTAHAVLLNQLAGRAGAIDRWGAGMRMSSCVPNRMKTMSVLRIRSDQPNSLQTEIVNWPNMVIDSCRCA